MFSTMKDNKSMYLNKPSKILHKISVQRNKSLHELSAKYQEKKLQNIKRKNQKLSVLFKT